MFQFGYFLTVNKAQHPDRLAVADGHTGLTWTELDREASRCALAMRRRGLCKGDRVALLWHNSVQWAIIWYAAFKIGAVACPLNARLLPCEIAEQMRIANAKALFFAERFAPLAKEALGKGSFSDLVLVCEGSTDELEAWRFDDFVEEGACWRDAEVLPPAFRDGQLEDVGEDDGAVILFTSGTTGAPKGVLRTQRIVRDHALVLALENWGRGDPQCEVMLTSSPLYHTAGLLCVLKMAAVGGTLILVDRFDPPFISECIGRYRVTQVLVVPPIVYERFYASDAWRGCDFSSVREVLISAGRCDERAARHVFEMFPSARLRFSWGMTETCSLTGASVSREEFEERPHLISTIGTVNPLVEIRLVSEDGDEVPLGQVGEAWVRSSLVCDGYIDAGGGVDASPFDEGWFRTGDMLSCDDRGYYTIVDRKKDVIKSGGENVWAIEVERILTRHPAIQDCAVVGVPDERFEEAVGAAIVVASGKELMPDELIEFCRENLSSYKKPRYWACLEKLPTNSIGKVQKGVLRSRAEELFKPLVPTMPSR